MDRKFDAPGDLSGEEAAVPYQPDERPLSAIEVAVRSNEGKLLGIDGVEGLAAGNDAVVVYTRDESVADRVPNTIGEYPVEIVVTGKIRAL